MLTYPIQLLLFTWLFLVPVKETGKVIAVKDGDTIEVLLNGKAQRIRLAHIDCPEKNQPYGTKAKLYTSEKCFGQLVTLAHNRQYDRNKRLIAEVILSNGDTLNRELVKTGLAWHYKKYSADSTYNVQEIRARLAKKGLWVEKEPVAPWLWRSSRQSAVGSRQHILRMLFLICQTSFSQIPNSNFLFSFPNTYFQIPSSPATTSSPLPAHHRILLH